MNDKIALCDRQAGFVSILSRRLSDLLAPSGIEVLAFDDVKKLLDSPQAGQCRLCLVGEQMLDAYLAERLAETVPEILYLTEDKNRPGIFKYQSVSDLTKQIVSLLLEKEDLLKNPFPAGEGRARIYGIYSPVRPLVQSALGLTLGQLLAEDKKVLYLNFEPYSGMEYLMQKEFSRGLSELFFYLRDTDGKLSWRIEALAEKLGKLYYIPPVLAYQDLEEIEPDGFCTLAKKLATETDFEVLILDLSEVTGLFSVLQCCDRILCPYTDDPLSEAKVNAFEQMLDFMKYQSVREKTLPLCLPAFSRLPRQMESLPQSEIAQYVIREILSLDEAG